MLHSMISEFCAYVHARPGTTDVTGIFYVGKGTGARARRLLSRNNKHHQNIVKKYGAENILVGSLDCSSEEAAFELEKGMIKCLKRMGVKLANKTEGGDGPSGLVFSKASKALISASLMGNTHLLGHKHTPEARKKMSVNIRHAHEKDPTIAKRISEALRGNKYHLGHRHSEETLAKLAKASTGRVHKEESKRKIGEAQLGELNHRYGKPAPNRGVPQTAEAKEKLSAAIQGRKMVEREGMRKMPAVEKLPAYLAAGWVLVK